MEERLARTLWQWCINAVLCEAGFVVIAAPMILSELSWSMEYAGTTRIMIALICGAIASPVMMLAMHGKARRLAFCLIFIPPLIAAIFAAWFRDEDDSFLHIAAPLAYGCALLVFLVLRDQAVLLDQAERPSRCPHCGYDLRGIPAQRCPECGGDPRKPSPRRAHVHATVRRLPWMVVALAASGTLQSLFIRWLLSLG